MNIRDKIAKLLALAESPSENEARVALLKARELMAQYKLRPEDCFRDANVSVRRELIDVRVSKTKYKWAIELSSIIASHYCCRAYRNHVQGERMYTIGFVGLEDDFEVCKRIFLYAFDCAKSNSDQVYSRLNGCESSYRRSLAESYGFGFVRGLRTALQAQDAEKQQEWGLVMVVPKAVDDAMDGILKVKKAFARVELDDDNKNRLLAMGYQDGKRFDPSTKLENTGDVKRMYLQGAV